MSGRQWTRDDEDFLAENAGILPVADLAIALGRTENAVRVRASEMRDKGRDVRGLLVYEPISRRCPECGEMRTRFTHGICCVCRQVEHVEEYKDENARIWDSIPEQIKNKTLERSGKESTISNVSSIAFDPQPKPTSDSQRSDYRASKAMDEYYAEMEDWELRKLNREWAALRHRRSTYRNLLKKIDKYCK